MKRLVLAIMILTVGASCGDRPKTDKNSLQKIGMEPGRDSVQYQFPIPDKWTTEVFAFPPPFASSIPYTGHEAIRFAPGWGYKGSDEHWTYIFLWYLHGKHSISAQLMEQHLNAYYDGLVRSNIEQKKIPASRLLPTKAALKEVSTAPGDQSTYEGTVVITNYLDIVFNPITLYLTIHQRTCGDNTAVLTGVTSKPSNLAVLESVAKGFACGK